MQSRHLARSPTADWELPPPLQQMTGLLRMMIKRPGAMTIGLSRNRQETSANSGGTLVGAERNLGPTHQSHTYLRAQYPQGRPFRARS